MNRISNTAFATVFGCLYSFAILAAAATTPAPNFKSFSSESTATPIMSCTAKTRKPDPNDSNKAIENQEVLKLTEKSEAFYRLEGTLEGKSYTVTIDAKNGDAYVSILDEPNYTKGIINRGHADSQGRLNLSIVEGLVVHQVICSARN